MIDVDDLPAEILTPTILTSATFELPAEGISLEELEQQLIEQAMHRANGVISRAAPLLGMSYKTLQYRLDKFGLNRNAAKAKE
jgi:DNA-binding NtrC family response regulator